MPENGALPECCEFPESVRLLWEATQKALEESGLDRQDLALLCDVIVRLADHRLLLIEAKGSPPGSESVAAKVQDYWRLALTLRERELRSPYEPAWSSVQERLREAGAKPLDLPALPKE
jgi:hypothetical protein